MVQTMPDADTMARLRAQIAPPSLAELMAFYDAHPALFARRRVYALMHTRIGVGIERSTELAALLATIQGRAGSIGEFFDWMMDHGIVYTASQTVQASEDMPSDLLAVLQHAAPGAAHIVAMETGPILLQVVNIEEQARSFAESRAAIDAFLRNQQLAVLISQASTSADADRYAP